jgi:hypothetical protein
MDGFSRQYDRSRRGLAASACADDAAAYDRDVVI